MFLRVEELRTVFRTRQGVVKSVDGISYDVEDGETIALVGESGCGKSTSALSILRLIPDPPGQIVGGEIRCEGEDLLKLNGEGIRRVRGKKIAMVFQEPMTSLNPVLSIGRQIMEPLQVHWNLSRDAAREQSIRLLRELAIADAERRIDQYPHQFSGGMRQRVMLAIALSCRPKLLIADEPTTAVDVTIQAQLLEFIARMTQDLGVAVILITHNLGIVARYARRVNVMYAGRIVEQGAAREIYARPRHPYTIGLLESVPRLDRKGRDVLVPIAGRPPDLVNLPAGCAFSPRCRYRVDRCLRECPSLLETSERHLVACWVDVGGSGGK